MKVQAATVAFSGSWVKYYMLLHHNRTSLSEHHITGFILKIFGYIIDNINRLCLYLSWTLGWPGNEVNLGVLGVVCHNYWRFAFSLVLLIKKCLDEFLE